jgi:hypothetical protein
MPVTGTLAEDVDEGIEEVEPGVEVEVGADVDVGEEVDVDVREEVEVEVEVEVDVEVDVEVEEVAFDDDDADDDEIWFPHPVNTANVPIRKATLIVLMNAKFFEFAIKNSSILEFG